MQSPNFFGCIENLDEISEIVHQKGIMIGLAVSEPLSLALLKAPEKEQTLLSGKRQSFGIPMSYGGPGVGFLATKMNYVRMVPGRLVGKTLDLDGKECFILTLQAREQHIRREKSISNICSNYIDCIKCNNLFVTFG